MYRKHIKFLHFETETYETNKRVLRTMDRSQIVSFSVEHNIRALIKETFNEYFLYNFETLINCVTIF